MFYLKYRPQRISELDSARIRETLGKALLENNWAHAYLLIGARGTGKTSTARLIAKVVNCSKRKSGEEPCNQCDSCRAITEGRSLDVIEIDAASNTGVEDIRDLREKVKLAPTSGRYKVYIIDEVHMLSTSAFNALLKTLEEPPEHVIFVLATTDPQKLPETIVSRCLVYNFGKAARKEIISGLEKIIKNEKITIQEDVIVQIAVQANGSHRDAAKFLEQLAMQSDNITMEHMDALNRQDIERLAWDILHLLAENNTAKALKIVEAFVESNGRARDLLTQLISSLRDILLRRLGLDTDVEELKLNDEAIHNLITDLIAAGSLSRESPIPQLPLELVIAKFHQTSIIPTVEPGLTVEPVSPKKTEAKKTEENSVSPEVIAKWPEVLEAIKPYNHSLVALLRGARPKELEGSVATISVFYKFHKDKLSESKNRVILEKVLSDIIGREVTVKFELSEKEARGEEKG